MCTHVMWLTISSHPHILICAAQGLLSTYAVKRCRLLVGYSGYRGICMPTCNIDNSQSAVTQQALAVPKLENGPLLIWPPLVEVLKEAFRKLRVTGMVSVSLEKNSQNSTH